MESTANSRLRGAPIQLNCYPATGRRVLYDVSMESSRRDEHQLRLLGRMSSCKGKAGVLERMRLEKACTERIEHRLSVAIRCEGKGCVLMPSFRVRRIRDLREVH